MRPTTPIPASRHSAADFPQIICANDGRHFAVRDGGEDYPQAYIGIAVQRVSGQWMPKAGALTQLVRRAGSQVVA